MAGKDTVEFYGRFTLKPEYRKRRVEEREHVERYIAECIGKHAADVLSPVYEGPLKDTPCHLMLSGKKMFDAAFDPKVELKVMLEKLTRFVEEGSSLKCRSWSGKFWRIILKQGEWQVQNGTLFYEPEDCRDYSNFEIHRGTYTTKLTKKELKAAHAYYSKILEGKNNV